MADESVGKNASSVASLEFTLWAEVRRARVRPSVISYFYSFPKHKLHDITE